MILRSPAGLAIVAVGTSHYGFLSRSAASQITIAPVIKAFLGRAKATEVLVQQEFVNLLTSRPQVNELMATNP